MLGDLIIFVGTVAFAIYTILEKRIAGSYDDLVLNTFVFWLGAVLMLPFAALPVITMHWTHVPSAAWWGLALLVICGSVIAYPIYAFALNELAASKVAAFSYLQPIIVAVLAVVFSGEHIGKMEIAAGALVLFGMYVSGGTSRRYVHHLAHSGT
ncbi:MAG: DMT family transporter [Acidobacteriota bacterium]|nr:DMT family transporter [Acidobacteriota bacterium]